MASKLVGTVVRSLRMPAAPQGDLVQQVVDTITAAAAQEGVILHHKSTVGVPRALPEQLGLGADAFEQKLREALRQATGVSLQVLLFGGEVDAAHPLCSLCTLTAGRHADACVVLVQGETPAECL